MSQPTRAGQRVSSTREPSEARTPLNPTEFGYSAPTHKAVQQVTADFFNQYPPSQRAGLTHSLNNLLAAGVFSSDQILSSITALQRACNETTQNQ